MKINCSTRETIRGKGYDKFVFSEVKHNGYDKIHDFNSYDDKLEFSLKDLEYATKKDLDKDDIEDYVAINDDGKRKITMITSCTTQTMASCISTTTAAATVMQSSWQSWSANPMSMREIFIWPPKQGYQVNRIFSVGTKA